MARISKPIKFKKIVKKSIVDPFEKMIEKEYWDVMELKDPITGEIKKHKVKVVRYKHRFASLEDIEEQDHLLERLSHIKKPKKELIED